jgi:tRNA pseudouridine38-40 synthase
MRNLKMTLAYDGTRFVGWQRQAAGESIQGLLEQALARFEGTPVTVHGAGRTDAGVHALGQVASARVTFTHDAATLARALNAQLPGDVRVIEVADVDADFHARFSARSKTYRYEVRTGSVSSPFDRAYTWQLSEPLDIEAMRQGAAALLGRHDFAAFRSAGTDIRSTIRTMHRSEILSARCGVVAYEITGDGFLRHMVRAIVGTLIEVGRGWRPAIDVADLVAGGTRADAGATAPARGLFLVRVDYHEDRDVP